MNEELPSRQSALDRMRPSQNFLIAMGLFILFYIIGNIIGILCLNLIGGLNLMQMENLDMKKPEVLLAVQVGQIVGAIICFIVPVVIYTLITQKQRVESLTLNHGFKIPTFLIAGVLILCANPLINYMTFLNSKLPFPDFIRHLQDAADKETEAFLSDMNIPKLILNIFMIGVLAAVGEELFFRAVLQKIFINWTRNVHIGVIITGIVFSLVHLEFLGFFPRMLMGIYLGYLFVWTKSIWVPMFAHFMNNSSVVIYTYLEDKHIISTKIEDIGSDNSQMTYVIISTVITAIFTLVIYKIESRKKEVQVS